MARDSEFTVGVVWELTVPLLLRLACRDDIEAEIARYREEPDRDEDSAAWFAWTRRLCDDAEREERRLRLLSSNRWLWLLSISTVLVAALIAFLVSVMITSCPPCGAGGAVIPYVPGDEVMDTAWPVENAGSAGGMGYGR